MAPLIAFSVAVSGVMPFTLTAGTNAAETPSNAHMVLSNGQITCGEFLTDSPHTQASDTEWVLGYISGRNREAPAGRRMAGTSFTAPDSVTAWLQNYCRTHALNHLVEAADELRTEFLLREGPR